MLSIGFWQKAVACDCFFIPTFCEAITFDNNGQIHDYLTIQRIKVLSLGNNGLNVGITQTFFGENYVGQTLFLKDGNGADCGLFASTNLEVGKEYIVASFGDSTEIMLSDCYISFLKVENGVVAGAIAPGVTQVDLADFTNIGNCGELNASSVEEEPTSKGNFMVLPTLTTGNIYIYANSKVHLPKGKLQISVYDVTGRLVTKAGFDNFHATNPVYLDAANWATGLYFLQMEAGGLKETVKVMKV